MRISNCFNKKRCGKSAMYSVLINVQLCIFIFNSASELKTHGFFSGIDWNQVYCQRYVPPLIPPRGEVNAADAFDIGSFDEEDTKGIKV